MRKPLNGAEIAEALTGLKNWRVEGEALERTYRFEGFRQALAFIVRIGFECEQMNHHPDLQNVYNRVTIRLNTHDVGGKITQLDIELARKMERIAGSFGVF